MKSVTEKGLGSTFAKTTVDKKERGVWGGRKQPPQTLFTSFAALYRGQSCFFNNSWYTKALCRLKNPLCTFVLRRIKKAELLKRDFEPNKEIISSVNPDDFPDFEKIKNVKLHAASYALDLLKSSPLHTHQIIHDDGTVEIPAVAKEVLFPFILSQGGKARLLEPAELKSELKSKLQKMLEQY